MGDKVYSFVIIIFIKPIMVNIYNKILRGIVIYYFLKI